MTHWWMVLALAGLVFVNGCLGPAGDEGAAEPADTLAAVGRELTLIEWKGHTTVGGPVDLLTHSVYAETVLYPVHQSGFLLEIHDVPHAIEVRVDWDEPLAGNAVYQLHPHYIASKTGELTGDTEYYGYRSDNFDESGGCVRIPAADMYAGVWPMMVHAGPNTLATDLTITVGVVGSTASVLDERHGHRLGGNSMDDHGVESCQLLVDRG